MPRPPQQRKSLQIEGEWFRWTNYQLIFNTPMAVFRSHDSEIIRYDPWTPYRRNEGARLREPQPYLTLLNLGKQVREHRDQEPELVLDWCNANGLLGILPAFANTLLFPHMIDEGNSPSANSEYQGPWYRALQLRYVRSGGIWRSEIQDGHWTSDRSMAVQEGQQFETPPEYSRNPWNRATYAERSKSVGFFPIIGELDAKLLPPESLGEDPFAPYPNFLEKFVDPRGDGDREIAIAATTPLPGSRKFFDVYGERVRDIADWAMQFEDAVRELNSVKAHRGLGFLAEIATAASPTFRLGTRGDLEEVRVSAGLLSSFALMVLWDFEAGRRIHDCKNCGMYLVSRDRRAGYCSVTCRNTAQSRRYRAKKKLTSKGD
jgi:hypothetical protein